jgi:hypothetical protein
MKNKILLIGILILIIAGIIPITNATYIEENETSTQAPWLRIGFIRGEIYNIREEYYNGKLGYNCSTSGVKITWYTYVLPLNFTVERVDVPDTDWFFVWNYNFFGILRDGLIFGWVISAGLRW